jgi:uncharacterized protein
LTARALCILSELGACHAWLSGAEIWADMSFYFLGNHQADFALNFLSLFLEGAPYILLGTMISGFLDVYMPSSLMDRLLPRNRFLAILSCGLMGLVLPVCECAVVPVIRRLVAKGLPISCAFTYMLAAPIVNPVTIWSTWHAFSDQDQWWVVISRIGMGYGVAVIVGVILLAVPAEKVLRDSLLKSLRTRREKQERQVEKTKQNVGPHHHHDHEGGCCGHDHQHIHTEDREDREDGNRVVMAIRSGVQDCVDVAVYFSIGVCLTAMFNIWYVLNQDAAAQYLDSIWMETGGMMVLAFVLSVCSTSDAFMAATLRGVGIGSKMAFMVLGPMLDVKLLFLYQTLMRKKFLFCLAIGLFIVIGLLSVSWQEYEPFREFFRGLEGGRE